MWDDFPIFRSLTKGCPAEVPVKKQTLGFLSRGSRRSRSRRRAGRKEGRRARAASQVRELCRDFCLPRTRVHRAKSKILSQGPGLWTEIPLPPTAGDTVRSFESNQVNHLVKLKHQQKPESLQHNIHKVPDTIANYQKKKKN